MCCLVLGVDVKLLPQWAAVVEADFWVEPPPAVMLSHNLVSAMMVALVTD